VKNDVKHKSDQSVEWQEIQKNKFKEIQKRISDLRENVEISDKISSDISLDTSDSDNSIEFMKQNEPLLSLMLALSQNQVEELIDIISMYLEENLDYIDFCEQVIRSELNWITKWTYATMACLQIPLVPEVHSSIRTIAKCCIQINENLKTALADPKIALPFNLIILIIVKNFHQFDLMSL
jgi:gem associated protein 2